MNNGKSAFRLAVMLILVFLGSGLIFLVTRSWLHEWAVGLAILFAAIVGPLAGRFFYPRHSATTKAQD